MKENKKKREKRERKKLTRKQKVLVGITSILVVTGGGVAFVEVSKASEYKKIEQNLSEIYKIPGREKVFMNGKILPVISEKLTVDPEQGQLSEIKVSDNDYVEKGAPLYTCQNNSQIKEIQSLQEQISSKKKDKANAQDEETRLMIDEEIKSLNKQVRDLNKTAYSTVYAPFSGTVYLNQGSDDESHVMILETLDLYVQGQVNERDSYKISQDQGVEIKALATGEGYTGKITKIGDRPFEGANLGQSYGADAGMTKYEVKMNLENQQGLKHGLNVQIVAFSKNTTIKLPSISVIEEGGKYYVFRIKNKEAVKTEVKVVDKKEEYYVIEGGLKENEEIIKDISGMNINNGDRVYTQNDLHDMKNN